MRSLDDDGGKLIAATYARMLGDYPREALAHMVERAIAELKWFPTVAECREMLATWRRTDGEVDLRCKAANLVDRRDAAQAAAHRERVDAEMRRLERNEATQDEVDQMAATTRYVAEARGILKREGNRFLLRKPAF
jgi:heme oxygenase